MTVQTEDISHAGLSREVKALVAARVVDRLGGFTMTFLPLLLVTAYGGSLRAAGLVAAAFGLATIPSRLLGGRLADQLGHRSTIVLGLTGCAVGQLCLAGAPGLVAALAAAVFLGLCFEVYEPPSQALLADLTPPRQRAAAYSALGAAMAASGVMAGLLAALLLGIGMRWLFVADAVTSLACAVVVRFALPGRAGIPVSRPGSGSSPWRDRRLLAMLAAGTAFATAYMVMMAGLPLALHVQGVASRWAGLLVAVSAITVIAGQRLRRLVPAPWSPFGRMALAYVLLALGLTLAVPAAATGTGLAYVVPVVVWSLGDVILLGEPFAIVAELAAERDRGRYLAAYGVSWGVALTVGPLLTTGLVAAGGPTLLWLVCAALCATLAVGQSPLRTAVTRK
jgi:MFS family permease